MREFSPIAIILGVLIGVLFGAANAYIGLKVGMTVSASIPAAVISMAILRGILKRGTLLENNIVQTIGSVGESLAAGMIFTIPALFIFAYTDKDPSMAPSLWEMAVWGALGGLLGVFFMIPLRRMLIVKEHGKLPYPEGTACAEVLQAGQAGGVSAKTVFLGLGVGAVYEFFRGLGFWAEHARQRLPLLKTGASLAAEPALLGVGYILGIRVAGYILGGAVLGWFVIIPAIAYFGAEATSPLAPADVLISQMSPGDMWDKYLRYIGAGAVVLGGLVSLFKSFGTIGGSLFHMFSRTEKGESGGRDIPTPVLLLLIAAIGVGLWYLPQVTWTSTGEDGVTHVNNLVNPLFKNITVIACVLTFGFFFTTVSSRLVGIVGSSSNPASGMTIATLLGTALIIVNTMDLDPAVAKVAIIAVGAMVCLCICMAGDTSQDLKTGYLVGATPWKQQMGQVVGVLFSTLAIAGVLWLINERFGYFKDAAHPNAVLAPQANLMKLLVQGIVDAELPWQMILIGMAAALIIEMLGLPSLPFAVGLYLPLSLSTPIMAGGIVRWLVDKRRKTSETHSRGVLAASGLVAGQGIIGVIFIGVAAAIGAIWGDPRFVAPKYHEEAKIWANYDATPDTWTHLDDQQNTVYFNEAHGEWVTGTPTSRPGPLPASQPTTEEAPLPRGDLVVAHHFVPWLTTKLGFWEPEYGLRPLAFETKGEDSAWRGDYAVDWYKLMPLIPFGMMTVWLFFVAMRRAPDDGEPAPARRVPGGGGRPAGGGLAGVPPLRPPPPRSEINLHGLDARDEQTPLPQRGPPADIGSGPIFRTPDEDDAAEPPTAGDESREQDPPRAPGL